MPSTMVASSEQCRRHVSGGTSAVSSFSDDGVVQTVLRELKGFDQDERSGTKPPLVSKRCCKLVTSYQYCNVRIYFYEVSIYGCIDAPPASASEC